MSPLSPKSTELNENQVKKFLELASIETSISESFENCHYRHWHENLLSARLIVAPMVDQSELAWRMLAREHGAQLCYSPMLHAEIFANDATYRRENLTTCAKDRPLIVQFCANDPDILLRACSLVAPLCDGVDINLGCPQSIARKGRYGAFLHDQWDLVYRLVNIVHLNCSVPISCKIRVFHDVAKTVEYAKMLEIAGCQLLTVHGRTREQKGVLTGMANWSQIKAVKEAVRIPVFANGNIQNFEDIATCFEATNADGVMTAEGHRSNPYIFENRHEPTWEVALAYLDSVNKYPCPPSYIRAHLFKLFHHSMTVFSDIRDRLARVTTIAEFRQVIEDLKSRCSDDNARYLQNPSLFDTNGCLTYPHWICQPYTRPIMNDGLPVVAYNTLEQREFRARKRQYLVEMAEQTGMSKRHIRRLERRGVFSMNSNGTANNVQSNCRCGNSTAVHCQQNLCRKCCLEYASEMRIDCHAHRLKFALNLSSPVVPLAF